ncbi:MAG: glycoside hydrolase family 3 C-terminal domain-containing protein [Halanaerobiales bacterium]
MSVKKVSIEVFPYRNHELPLEDRVNDLLSRLTIEEKISLIPTKQAAVERLGIEAYSVGGEAAHGWVSRDGDPATVFPQPIGLACTWNPELMEKIGSVIGDEARIYNKKKNTGLTLWAPTVDMERDPRWGRTEEAYGEDPYLTGTMATALVKGMQGDHPFYLKMASALKHFFANNNEHERCYCSVSIDPRNMREYYWEAFRPVIEDGKACCIMTSYNEINGRPAILNKDVKTVVKGKWGLPGFAVADGADFGQTVNMHHYYNNHAESIAETLKSGIDCIPDDPELIINSLREALEKELLSEEDIDNALFNIFRIRFRLGQFDPEESNPYAKISESKLCSPEHNKLALEAARESIVLLKNENNTLPLNKESPGKVAVIGPLGDVVYRDWYTGVLPYKVTPLKGIQNKLADKEVIFTDCTDLITLKSPVNNKYILPDNEDKLIAEGERKSNDTLYDFNDWGWGRYTLKSHSTGKYLTSGDGLSASADQVYGWFVRELYNFIPQRDGSYKLKTWDNKNVFCNSETSYLEITDQSMLSDSAKFIINTEDKGIDQAVKAAREADVAIVFVGNHPLVNGKEEIDREDITLPPAQEELVKAVYEANPNTVLVVISSYPIAINWAEENIPAILYSSHAGQETGNAIADVLFGDFNPAGRLCMTWYKSVYQLADIMDYDIIKGKRTYMYFDEDPLYPFGHGLTYTQFKYSGLEIKNRKITADGFVDISFQVKNVGSVSSDEVVQLYVNQEKSRVRRPGKELKRYQKISLEPGEGREISFSLAACELSFWDVTRDKFCLEKGFYKLMVGSSSSDIRLTGRIQIDGEIIPPRDLSILTEAYNYDDYQGIILDEIKESQDPEGGTCVKFIEQNNWIAFHDIDFDKEFTSFEITAASEFDQGQIELRLDYPDGPLIGICEVAPREGLLWQKSTCNIEPVRGKHDLYLKTQPNIKIASFRFGSLKQ